MKPPPGARFPADDVGQLLTPGPLSDTCNHHTASRKFGGDIICDACSLVVGNWRDPAPGVRQPGAEQAARDDAARDAAREWAALRERHHVSWAAGSLVAVLDRLAAAYGVEVPAIPTAKR